MKDRFRFRAWNKEEKKMYYDAQDTYDYMVGKPVIFAESFGCLLINDEEWEVEQCTGLKDKNGNLIYEGDKVEISVYGDVINEGFVETDTQYQGIVVWAKQGFYVKVADEFFYIPEEPEDVEIIGNIHEQAEQKD